MAYSAITKLYAKAISKKKRVIDSVPEEYKEQVMACVAELYPETVETSEESVEEHKEVSNSGSGGTDEGTEPSADSEGGEADA